jgi:hypothetical protein
VSKVENIWNNSGITFSGIPTPVSMTDIFITFCLADDDSPIISYENYFSNFSLAF